MRGRTCLTPEVQAGMNSGHKIICVHGEENDRPESKIQAQQVSRAGMPTCTFFVIAAQ
jgi:hypothetical protein